MALSLAGKTAIITGAGSGINLAFARSLLRRKCNVLFADLALRPEAKDVVDKYQSRSKENARAFFQETNVREWNQLERMFKVAKEEFGDVDVVCPGAGVYEPRRGRGASRAKETVFLEADVDNPFSNFWQPPSTGASQDPRDSDRFAILDINLTHPIRTTQLALSHFLSDTPPKRPTTLSQPVLRPPKTIIHISSIAGQLTPLPAPIYNATKHAINGFVRTFAPLSSDPKVNVRVVGVAPGLIKTPLWTDNPEKMRYVGDDDIWVTAETVADAMTALVEQDEIDVTAPNPASAVGGASGDARDGTRKVKVTGGMILEIGKGPWRVVEQFLDPGPSGIGNSVGNMALVEKETLDHLSGGGWGAMS